MVTVDDAKKLLNKKAKKSSNTKRLKSKSKIKIIKYSIALIAIAFGVYFVYRKFVVNQ